jgi:hypothetical protein
VRTVYVSGKLLAASVDIEHGQPTRAGRNADVRIRPPLPPLRNLDTVVSRGVEAAPYKEAP